MNDQEVPETFPVPTPANKRATLTFAELREGISQRYNAISAIDVDYRETLRDFEPVEPDYVPIGAPIDRHFAMKGEKRFRAQTVDIRSVVGLQQNIWAFDGRGHQGYDIINKSAHIGLRPHHYNDGYLHPLGILKIDGCCASSSQTDNWLPIALDVAENEWKVHPVVEVFDGAECHVLKAKSGLRMWIDPKIGFALRFLETRRHVADMPTAAFPLGTRWGFRNFELIGDFLWLPMRIETVDYHSVRQPQNLWNQPRQNMVRDLSRLAVNAEVSDSMFTLSYPPGTVVTDERHNKFYRVGDGGEEIDLNPH